MHRRHGAAKGSSQERADRLSRAKGPPAPIAAGGAGNLALAGFLAASAGTLQRNGLEEDEREAIERLGLNGELKGELLTMAEAAKRTRAYQATRSRNLSSIMEEGLLPERGGTGASQKSAELTAASQNKVNYTTLEQTADAYKAYFGGKHTFLGEGSMDTSEAEVLKLALSSDIAAEGQTDPDSVSWSESFHTHLPIPKEAIRSKRPGPRAEGAAQVHQAKGLYELEAIVSNWPREPVPDLTNPDVVTRLHMLRKALQSVVVRGGAGVPDRTLFD